MTWDSFQNYRYHLLSGKNNNSQYVTLFHPISYLREENLCMKQGCIREEFLKHHHAPSKTKPHLCWRCVCVSLFRQAFIFIELLIFSDKSFVSRAFTFFKAVGYKGILQYSLSPIANSRGTVNSKNNDMISTAAHVLAITRPAWSHSFLLVPYPEFVLAYTV